jgi:hypothetical protein
VSEPTEQDTGFVYDVADASYHSGTIAVPYYWRRGRRAGGKLFAIEPSDPDYTFWLWLVANRERFPEVNKDNAAALQAAFQSLTSEELEKVTRDHGLPDL